MEPARRCSGSARFSIKHSSRHASAVAGGIGSVQCGVDPADVVGQGIAGDEEPLVGPPQAQVARSVRGSPDDLPLGVTERQDLAIVELLIDGVGGDGLSRYSAWQQRGSRPATASASATLPVIPAPWPAVSRRPPRVVRRLCQPWFIAGRTGAVSCPARTGRGGIVGLPDRTGRGWQRRTRLPASHTGRERGRSSGR